MTEKKQKLRFGLPKGSLQEATIEKMAKAGFKTSPKQTLTAQAIPDSLLQEITTIHPGSETIRRAEPPSISMVTGDRILLFSGQAIRSGI